MKVKKILIITLSLILLTACSFTVSFESHEDDKTLEDVKAEFHFIDVGQGDATLIKLANYIVLVDAGPDNAEESIVNYLRSQGVQKIDLLIVTYPHDDHIGAIDKVLEDFEVSLIVDSGYYHPNNHYDDYESAITKEVLLGAKYLEDKDMKIEVNEDMLIEVIENADDWEQVNNQSVVTRITCGKVSLLLTGDLEKEGEKALLESGVNITADVFAAGHHGSSTSNTIDFIERVNPQIAVISAGLNNQYGLPHKEVRELFEEKNIETYETAYYGSIVLKTDGERVVKENNKLHQIEIVSVNNEDEIVTIKNMSKIDVDLTNWYLISYTGNQRYDFPSGYVLKAGKTVNITSGKNAFDDGVNNLKWTTKNVWSNSKRDPAYLYSGEGLVVGSFH